MLTINASSGAAYATYLKDFAVSSNPDLLSTELSTLPCPPAPPAESKCFRVSDTAMIPSAVVGVRSVSVASLEVGSRVFTRNGQVTTVIAKHIHRGAHRFYRFQSCPSSPNASTCVGYAVTHGHLVDVRLDDACTGSSDLLTVPEALEAWRSVRPMFLTDGTGRALPLTSVEETVEDIDSVFLVTSSLDMVVNGVVASCRTKRDAFIAPLFVAMHSVGLSPQKLVEARFGYLPELFSCPNPLCLAVWTDTLLLGAALASALAWDAVSRRRTRTTGSECRAQ